MTARNKTVIEGRLQARQRIGFSYPGDELDKRLADLRVAYFFHDPENKEMLKYYPIAFAACIESYFRGAIKILIDSREDFLKNSRKLLNQQPKLDFDMMRKLQDEITVGDVVSLFISINNLENIQKSMSQIMGIDFFERLSKVHARQSSGVSAAAKDPVIEDREEVLRYVARTFELRNIFCHESATGFDVDSEEISKCVKNSEIFLRASEELISQTLFPGKLTTEEEMNRAGERKYRKEKRDVDRLLTEAAKLLSGERKRKLKEASDAFDVFVGTSAEIELECRDEGAAGEAAKNRLLLGFLRERKSHMEKLVESLRKDVSRSSGG